jgi:hypothetical protein
MAFFYREVTGCLRPVPAPQARYKLRRYGIFSCVTLMAGNTLAGSEGLEPPVLGLGNPCSIP